MVEPVSDYELIHWIANQDRAAMETLYDRYERLVYNFAMRFVRAPDAAEEIVQDVFLKIWQKASSYDPDSGKPTTWILTICRNTAVDTLRKRRRLQHANEPEVLDRLPDTAGSVEFQAEINVTREKIQNALRHLPEDQRDVVELMYFQGMSQSEIARARSIPVGTVKGRARLALAKLREELFGLRKEETYGDA
jgi:RNA polymerase sigma factor (sigma-70 family)